MNRVLRGRGIARTAAKAPSLHAHSLLELAVLNVKEGVVRETYGALVAAHQAAYATDPELRIAFRRIARDEAAHAELSLDIASWLASKLDAKERAIVEAAHQEALACLYDECQRLDPSADVARETGMPSAKAALMMLNGLSSALRLAS